LYLCFGLYNLEYKKLYFKLYHLKNKNHKFRKVFFIFSEVWGAA